MAFDGIAVSAVVAELNDKLANTRVAKIYQPNRHTIIIHLRDIGQNHKLLISADPSSPRIHTTSAPDPNPQTPPAFACFSENISSQAACWMFGRLNLNAL